MSEINDLLALLPPRCRFVPQVAERSAFSQALEKGWTPESIADTIIAGIGPDVRNPSGLACHILRASAGSPPPAAVKTNQVGRPPGLPMPECRECGQPYGRDGGGRPMLGDKKTDCSACGEPLILVQWDPFRQQVMT